MQFSLVTELPGGTIRVSRTCGPCAGLVVGFPLTAPEIKRKAAA